MLINLDSIPKKEIGLYAYYLGKDYCIGKIILNNNMLTLISLETGKIFTLENVNVKEIHAVDSSLESSTFGNTLIKVLLNDGKIYDLNLGLKPDSDYGLYLSPAQIPETDNTIINFFTIDNEIFLHYSNNYLFHYGNEHKLKLISKHINNLLVKNDYMFCYKNNTLCLVCIDDEPKLIEIYNKNISIDDIILAEDNKKLYIYIKPDKIVQSLSFSFDTIEQLKPKIEATDVTFMGTICPEECCPENTVVFLIKDKKERNKKINVQIN